MGATLLPVPQQKTRRVVSLLTTGVWTVPAGVSWLSFLCIGGGGGSGGLSGATTGGTAGGQGGTTSFGGLGGAQGGLGGAPGYVGALPNASCVAALAAVAGTPGLGEPADGGNGVFISGAQNYLAQIAGNGKAGQQVWSIVQVNPSGTQTINYTIGAGGTAGAAGTGAGSGPGAVGGAGRIDIEYWL